MHLIHSGDYNDIYINESLDVLTVFSNTDSAKMIWKIDSICEESICISLIDGARVHKDFIYKSHSSLYQLIVDKIKEIQLIRAIDKELGAKDE